MEAVNYVDGDGGTINVAMFPGLSRHIEVLGITSHHLRVPRMEVVYFREKYHDATELGHQYTVTIGMHIHTKSLVHGLVFPCVTENTTTTMAIKEFGYLALVNALWSCHPSSLEQAQGLPFAQHAPGQHAATIPKGAYLCFFARGQVPPEGPGSDYELGSTRQGTGPQRVFDLRLYDGMNIGRFVNQGGLISGMKALVAASNRCDGCTTFQPNVAETIFDEACNAVYCCVNGGHDMVVKAAKDIVTNLDYFTLTTACSIG